jgi:hypothetical protein
MCTYEHVRTVQQGSVCCGGIRKGKTLSPLILQFRVGIHQIVIRTLSVFRYLCQQLAYLELSNIFLIASKIGESLRRYQEYPAKTVGKQGEKFLIAALVSS